MAEIFVSKDMPSETVTKVTDFITRLGSGDVIPVKFDGGDVHSDLIRSLLKVKHIHRGRITCILTAKSYACTNQRASNHFGEMEETVVSKEMPPETVTKVTNFITRVGGGGIVPAKFDGDGVQSDLIRSLLKVQHIHRGRITCILTVKPYACNAYNTLHGGVIGSVAEIVATACARTVVNKDKHLFLGELSVSYLAAAVNQSEVIVDAKVVRSGRNLTVVAIEFKLKNSEHSTSLCRATFYNMPVASL